MSETVRSFTGNTRARRRGPFAAYRGSLRNIRRAALLVLVACLLIGWWTTRDWYPMERLIPADQKYQIFANELLSRRSALAASAIWKAVPETSGASSIPALLSQDLEMPGWVLNHLAPNACCVSGNDLKAFSDALFVSRMTALGCLFMKFHGFVPGVSSDPAGGLNVDYHAKSGLYFAVRARSLVVSRSRDALIHALTLRPEDGLKDDAIAEARAESGAEDLRGAVAFDAEDPMGYWFQNVSFAIRVDDSGARVECRGALRPDRLAAWGDAVASLKPRSLLTPPDAATGGLAAISLDTGLSLHDTWMLAGDLFDARPKMQQVWDSWAGSSEAPPTALSVALRTVGPLGPGMRLSWAGIDANEIIPVPELIMTLDAASNAVQSAFDAIPPAPPGTNPWDTFPRYDAAAKRVTIPMFGGPSTQITAAEYGNGMLVSTSRTVADALLAKPAETQPLPTQGNLYIRVRPRAAFDAGMNVAVLLAEGGLLKGGITPETLPTAAAPWQNAFAAMEEASLLVACDQGEITLDLNVACTKTP